MNDINHCLSEILSDENGNTIAPECGIEKLLTILCEKVSSMSDNSEIDGGYPDTEV